MIKILFITLLLLSLVIHSSSQEKIFYNKIFKENIKTVLLHKDGWELSYPIIELNGDDKMNLSFDDLDNDIKNYSYTIIHCDYEWKESRLSQSDYIDGFTENPIEDYAYSYQSSLHNLTYLNFRDIQVYAKIAMVEWIGDQCMRIIAFDASSLFCGGEAIFVNKQLECSSFIVFQFTNGHYRLFSPLQKNLIEHSNMFRGKSLQFCG